LKNAVGVFFCLKRVGRSIHRLGAEGLLLDGLGTEGRSFLADGLGSRRYIVFGHGHRSRGMDGAEIACAGRDVSGHLLGVGSSGVAATSCGAFSRVAA
jgi:hypothetical protein